MNQRQPEAKAVLQGLGLAPGVRRGVAFKILPEGPGFYRLSIEPEDVERELARFDAAVARTLEQLTHIQEKFAEQLGNVPAQVIDAHMAIVQDHCFRGEISTRIKEGLESPERALRVVADQWLSVYRSIPDSFFRERGGDLEEVVERVSANLVELKPLNVSNLAGDLVVVAPTISLSSLAELDLSSVRGLVSTRGGAASHLTIVARSRSIPVVAGIDSVLDKIETGQELLIDGSTGTVYIEPSAELVSRLTGEWARESAATTTRAEEKPCETADGFPVTILANAEDTSDVTLGLDQGAEGIGLFRSEYLYLTEPDGPIGEEEQYQVYRALLEDLDGLPLSIRTVDIGDEGHRYFAKLAGSPEPVLGLRGVRLGLRYPEILRQQLRALLRASTAGDLRIILPMISTLDELRAVRTHISEVSSELLSEGWEIDQNVPLGIMIEVPSALYVLPDLASEVDFFSVGTNDLIQYLMAAGRSEASISELFTPLQPAVLRALSAIQTVCDETGVPAIVCGEAAASPVFASVLLGMGYRRLSVNPLAISKLYETVAKVDTKECARLVDALLEAPTLKEVRKTLAEWSELSFGVGAEG